MISAATAVLAETGFQGLGINTVARRAGCDKQLIYRYFGGLDGLIEALGTRLSTDLADALPPVGEPAASYADLMQRLASGLIAVLRCDALLQRIIVWELAAPSPLVAKLNAARSRALTTWMAAQRGDLAPPTGVDAPAMNAIIIAAVQHLVVSAQAKGVFAGLALESDADWDRLETAIGHMIQLVYGSR
ncbi:TetR/AcrR family transcriptional regulator [Devosia sp. FKR38]|uniref:TetR/AcrR family transcriptional regulator n=1 Tax=Devosia sp. FKR38 TaxID=2562312 RepID=UPI0020BEDA97|nr:TetR/AcrR family transcriptional regulator [Devosia sp. FKR38]